MPLPINALLRRVHADETVKQWAKALDNKIAMLQAREQRRREAHPSRSLSALDQLLLEEALTQRELVSRGLDISHSRRFRGRIALTIRCPQKGHALAHVYPTLREPVLVPTMAVITRPQTEGQKAERREQLRWSQEHTPWLSGAVRDPWLRAFDDGDGGIDFEIEGLVILKEGYRQEQYEHETFGLVRPACFLQCRCGRQLIAGADVMRALDAGIQNINAVWDE
jgi:hypothetical protein